MSQLQLMRTLKFNTEDLRANREGLISPMQRIRFEPPKANPIIVMTVLGHLVLVGGVLMALAFFTKALMLWVVFVIVMIMMLMPFGWMQESARIRPVVRGDVMRGLVEKRCGSVILHQKEGRKTRYDLIVDGIALNISAAEAEAFRADTDYCVYYLPASKTLLSAEPLM